MNFLVGDIDTAVPSDIGVRRKAASRDRFYSTFRMPIGIDVAPPMAATAFFQPAAMAAGVGPHAHWRAIHHHWCVAMWSFNMAQLHLRQVLWRTQLQHQNAIILHQRASRKLRARGRSSAKAADSVADVSCKAEEECTRPTTSLTLQQQDPVFDPNPSTSTQHTLWCDFTDLFPPAESTVEQAVIKPTAPHNTPTPPPSDEHRHSVGNTETLKFAVPFWIVPTDLPVTRQQVIQLLLARWRQVHGTKQPPVYIAELWDLPSFKLSRPHFFYNLALHKPSSLHPRPVDGYRLPERDSESPDEPPDKGFDPPDSWPAPTKPLDNKPVLLDSLPAPIGRGSRGGPRRRSRRLRKRP